MVRLILILALFSVNSYAIDCKIHPIYCKIIDNRPNIDKKYAMKLSNIIYKYTNKYNIDSMLYTAILAQESLYKLTAKNCVTGLVIIGDNKYEEKRICADFSISQINYRTAKAYNFDICRLLTDLDYAVEAGVIILKDIKKQWYKREPFDWWTRYNSGSKYHREIYQKLVERFL